MLCADWVHTGLLINLCTHSAAVQHSVTRLGGTRLVLRVLHNYTNNYSLQAKACWALSNLVCNRNTENQIILLRQNALVCVLDTLREHSGIASVVVRVVAFFAHMVEGCAETASAIVPLSVLPAAFECCATHAGVAAIMQHGCALLANVIDNGGRLLVARPSSLQLIRDTLDLHVEDPAAAAQVQSQL